MVESRLRLKKLKFVFSILELNRKEGIKLKRILDFKRKIDFAKKIILRWKKFALATFQKKKQSENYYKSKLAAKSFFSLLKFAFEEMKTQQRIKIEFLLRKTINKWKLFQKCKVWKNAKNNQ